MRRRPTQLVPMARQSAFGVSLMQTVDIYQQSERAGGDLPVLFIILTFLVFFLWEVFRATLLHPMQYRVPVGFALLRVLPSAGVDLGTRRLRRGLWHLRNGDDAADHRVPRGPS